MALLDFPVIHIDFGLFCVSVALNLIVPRHAPWSHMVDATLESGWMPLLPALLSWSSAVVFHVHENVVDAVGEDYR